MPLVTRVDVGAAVAKGKMPLATRSTNYCVQGMIVILVLETGEKFLAFVDRPESKRASRSRRCKR